MRTCLVAALLFCGWIGAQAYPDPAPFPQVTGTAAALPTATTPPSIYLIAAGSSTGVPADTTTDPNNPVPAYQADTFFDGGTAWLDPTMGTGIWGTLRYAPFFTYDIPVPNGFYSLRFELLEPNKTGSNQRVFTISVNGTTSDTIDIFAMTGGINLHTSLNMMSQVGNGHLRITFLASLGNAVVTAIEISPSNVFSGVEMHFLRIYTCASPLTDSVCIVVNPTGTSQ
jgi:hypothetical protein